MRRKCPSCGFVWTDGAKRSEEQFRLFHALVHEYSIAQGMDMVTAKDTLCILYGVSLEIGDDFLAKFPPWPGVKCELWGRKFFRKSTLIYRKKEMTALIEGATEAIHERVME